MRERIKLVDTIGKTNRSKITNNTRLFHKEIDGRTVEARRLRDIFNQLIHDFGGPNKLDATQKMSLRNVASLQFSCEKMESKLVDHFDDYDALAHVRMIGAINRTLDSINPEVRNKRVKGENDYPGSLEDYLADPETQARAREREKERTK